MEETRDVDSLWHDVSVTISLLETSALRISKQESAQLNSGHSPFLAISDSRCSCYWAPQREQKHHHTSMFSRKPKTLDWVWQNILQPKHSGGSCRKMINLRPGWTTEWTSSQSGLHGETLSWNQNQNKEKLNKLSLLFSSCSSFFKKKIRSFKFIFFFKINILIYSLKTSYRYIMSWS